MKNTAAGCHSLISFFVCWTYLAWRKGSILGKYLPWAYVKTYFVMRSVSHQGDVDQAHHRRSFWLNRMIFCEIQHKSFAKMVHLILSTFEFVLQRRRPFRQPWAQLLRAGQPWRRELVQSRVIWRNNHLESHQTLLWSGAMYRQVRVLRLFFNFWD